jgi:hypothetical protein
MGRIRHRRRMSLSGYNEPERSAEIGICEIFGRDVREQEPAVGMGGVHPFGDPASSTSSPP